MLIVFTVSRGGITVGSVLSPPPPLAFVFPCISRFNFPPFSCVRRTFLLRYNIVSMFQFIFLLYFSFGWSSKPTGDSGEGPAIIYDYFLESVYTCRLCKTLREPSLTWVRTKLVTYHHISDDTVGKTLTGFYHTPSSFPPFVLIYSYLFPLLSPNPVSRHFSGHLCTLLLLSLDFGRRRSARDGFA